MKWLDKWLASDIELELVMLKTAKTALYLLDLLAYSAAFRFCLFEINPR